MHRVGLNGSINGHVQATPVKGEHHVVGNGISPTNMKPGFADQATAFANELADTPAPSGALGETGGSAA